MSQIPTQQVTVRMTGGPQGASIVGPPGAAGGAFAPVIAATDNNVALTGIQTLDAIPGVANQRVFLAGQTNGAQDGLWLQQAGVWTRPSDFPTGAAPSGTTVYVIKGGAVFGRSIWTLETTGVTIDTTAQVWSCMTVPKVHLAVHQLAQTFVPRNTLTVFPFDTVDHDTAGGWNAGSHAYTIPYQGYYTVTAQVRWAADIGGLTFLCVRKNGSFIHSSSDHFGLGGSIAQTIWCAKGDVLDLDVYQNAVGNAGNDTTYPYATVFTIDLSHLDP